MTLERATAWSGRAATKLMATASLAFLFASSSANAFAADEAKAPADGKPGEQDVATGLQTEGVERARYNDIERGFSVRIPVGVMTYLTPVRSVAGDFSKGYTPGLLLGIELSYDIAQIFDLGVFFHYSHSAGSNVGLRRDLNSMLGGIMAHVSFFHTERFFLGARAGVGYGLQDTTIERLQHGIGVVAAISAEYFTRIRHFSLALDVGAMLWPSPLSVALTVTPSVRYTF